MKKFLAIILSFCLIISLTPVINVQANELNNELEDIFMESTFVEKTEDGGYIFAANTKEESVIQTFSNESGYNMTKTIFAIVPLDDKDKELLESISIARSQGGNSYKYAWDSTGSIKAYTQINYYIDTSGSVYKGSITSITGGYTKYDHTVSVISQTVNYGCVDVQYFWQSDSSYPTGASWVIYPPSNWSAINLSQTGYRLMGVSYSLEIKRNSSPWELTFLNDIYDDGFWLN